MPSTDRPLSFISWNSENFLKNKLDYFIDNNTFAFYMFIKHYPEPKDDMTGKEEKLHYHVYFEPFKRIDTNVMIREFEEIEEKGINRPARIQKSKFDNAYLYFIHDKSYLFSKGQERKHHYKYSDIITSSDFELAEKVRTIDYTKINKTNMALMKFLIESAKKGVSWVDLLETGQIPINQYTIYKDIYFNYLNMFFKDV